ncbi:hypothetical protein [uncultured Paraglaciecola sp.]|uniref:hypothetical protein n=1 Tax=uncultured Paraglaciecola sp. TaxID=1765024 RepID=UPI002621BE73|nr:hypothetical protein [uncultured Paraglaciecola sp.]
MKILPLILMLSFSSNVLAESYSDIVAKFRSQWLSVKAVSTTRTHGTVFSSWMPMEPDSRFRIQVNGTHQWGYGQTAPVHSFGPTHATMRGEKKRMLFEFQSNESYPVGLLINAKGNGGGAISITNESQNGNPCMVFRYENRPVVIARIPTGCNEV